MNDNRPADPPLNLTRREMKDFDLSSEEDFSFDQPFANQQENPLTQEMLSKGFVSSDYLRERLPSLWDIYWFLRNVGNIYLPPWKIKEKRPRWVSQAYFEGLLEERYFCLKRDQVKGHVPRIEWISKRKLIGYLEKEAGKPLGLNFMKEPPIKWITKLLYSLNPEHKIFKAKIEEKFDRPIPTGIMEKLMKMPIVKKKGAMLFGEDEEERKKRKLNTVRKMKERQAEGIEEQEKILARKKMKFATLDLKSQELLLHEREENGRNILDQKEGEIISSYLTRHV